MATHQRTASHEYYAPVEYSAGPEFSSPHRSHTLPPPLDSHSDADPLIPPTRPFGLHHNASSPDLRQSYDLAHSLSQIRLADASTVRPPLRGPSLPNLPRPGSYPNPRLHMTSNNASVDVTPHASGERRTSGSSLKGKQPAIEDLYSGIAPTEPSPNGSGSEPRPSPHLSQEGFMQYQQQQGQGMYQPAYSQPGPYAPQQAYYDQQYYDGYYAQQNVYQPSIGPDPGYYAQPGPSFPPAGPSYGPPVPPNQFHGPGLARQPTTISVVPRPLSDPTLARKKTSVGSTSTPPTKAAVDEYRNRIKADPDPETQFNFAKYLIEAARRFGEVANQKNRPENELKNLRRYRDGLIQESIKLIKKLATVSVGPGKPAYADAQFYLANLLSSGSLGLAVDHEKAYNLYVQASKQNHPNATYRTAVCNEIGAGTKRDPHRAVLFYRKASALGDPAGMYKLGMILLNGTLEQQRNFKEALLWLRRAAQQADEDNPHALHELGLLYEKVPAPGSFMAQHLPPDCEMQARELFIQAAKLGYPPSQHKLGMLYEFGQLGLPVDPRRSIAHYTRAAERNHASSELALSGWYLTGSEGVLKQSDEEAFLWARRAANKGLAKAEYAVGYYCEVGIGTRQDLEEAKRWYMRAAAQNHKRAMQRLTELKRSNVAAKRQKSARPTRQDAEKECTIM